jgi:hypothetical protein
MNIYYLYVFGSIDEMYQKAIFFSIYLLARDMIHYTYFEILEDLCVGFQVAKAPIDVGVQ